MGIFGAVPPLLGDDDDDDEDEELPQWVQIPLATGFIIFIVWVIWQAVKID